MRRRSSPRKWRFLRQISFSWHSQTQVFLYLFWIAKDIESCRDCGGEIVRTLICRWRINIEAQILVARGTRKYKLFWNLNQLQKAVSNGLGGNFLLFWECNAQKRTEKIRTNLPFFTTNLGEAPLLWSRRNCRSTSVLSLRANADGLGYGGGFSTDIDGSIKCEKRCGKPN